jgi:hypothetical protein
MLLRRIDGQPSVRTVRGEPLAPLDETAAESLDLGYLYAQGYLAQGDWTRPAVSASLHATTSTSSQTFAEE